MSYVVLARKWRPEHFEEVVGQGHVARTLKNSIEQNRVAHAYLFTGARGVGKTSTARILAKALNCKEGPTATPCYKCSSCLEISKGQSVDVFEIDGASNRGINEIRELREGARYAPSRDAKKIYIIDEVHMLTTEAFNALLKILEEPPAHVIFIFATTEPQKIPVTILSRCQRFDFKRITQRDIVEHLEHLCKHEGINADKAALQLIARQAAGGMRDALSLLDQIISFAGKEIREDQIAEILGVANRKHLFELSEAILSRNAEQALIVIDDVNRFGYDLNQFASELVNHFRDLMVTAVVKNPEDVTDLTESELKQARAQLDGVPKDLLHRHFTIMVEGARDMHRSPYPKLIFEMTLVRMAVLEPLIGLDLLVDKLRALEGVLEDSGTSAPPMEVPTAQKFSAPAHTPESRQSAPYSQAPAPVIQQQHENRAVAESQAPSPAKAEENLTPPDEPDPAAVAAIAAIAAPAAYPALESPRSPVTARPAPVSERVPELVNASFEIPEKPALAPVSERVPETVFSAIEIFETPVIERLAPVSERGPAPVSTPEIADESIEDPDDRSTPLNRWKFLVKQLKLNEEMPTAGLCEHAYLEQFEDELVRLSFHGVHMNYADDQGRLTMIEQTIQQHFGADYRLKIERRLTDEPSEISTLAQQRDAENNRLRVQLAEEIRQNPAILAAQELFEIESVRVQAQLYED